MIVIKGLTMPKGCTKCVYFVLYWNEARCRAKSRGGKNLAKSLLGDGWKPDWCPLIEVSWASLKVEDGE